MEKKEESSYVMCIRKKDVGRCGKMWADLGMKKKKKKKKKKANTHATNISI